MDSPRIIAIDNDREGERELSSGHGQTGRERGERGRTAIPPCLEGGREGGREKK